MSSGEGRWVGSVEDWAMSERKKNEKEKGRKKRSQRERKRKKR